MKRIVKSFSVAVALAVAALVLLWVNDSEILITDSRLFNSAMIIGNIVIGVLAVVHTISFIIYLVISIAEKIIDQKCEISGNTVFLISNLTLIVLSILLIIFFTPLLSGGMFNFSLLLVVWMMMSVVPVCGVCTIICVIKAIISRKRRG